MRTRNAGTNLRLPARTIRSGNYKTAARVQGRTGGTATSGGRTGQAAQRLLKPLALRRECKSGIALLVVEQKALHRESAAKAGQTAVGADHPMAGHDNRQRVAA